MQHSLKRAGLILLALFSVLCTIPQSPASGATAAGPQMTYLRAWQLVRDGYYDPTYNGQNWDTWRRKYDGKLETQQEAYSAIKEMLSSLNDPYTRFLDPKAFKEEDDAINSFVCGIGISLRPYNDTHALVINDVIEGGPAFKAGLLYGDKIVRIDGESAEAIDTEKAAEKIRGRAGTPLALTVLRGSGTKDFSLKRQQISIPSVSSKKLENNIGYIKLATFMADDASTEFRYALQKLNGTKGLIIDLRNNPGGLLANAVEIADMLLEHGKIVTTVSRAGKTTDACSGTHMTNQPIVLLVDHDSASASEILAGALRDNDRAVVVGTKTYGKGLVQEINRLPGGAGMHITVARYYTPSGSDINKIGIKPDVAVEERDKQLAAAINTLNQRVAQRGSDTPLNLIAAPPKRNPGDYRPASPRS